MPPTIAANVTTLPADTDAEPDVVGAMVEPGAIAGARVRSSPLEPADGAALAVMPEGAALGTEVRSRSLEPEVGAMVNAMSREPAEGAGVTAPAADGAGVKVPSAITHGAASVQVTFEARMFAEQQSDAPAVPAMLPQPVPPHTPLQASAQQTLVPSKTPSRPLGQVEGVTSVVATRKRARERFLGMVKCKIRSDMAKARAGLNIENKRDLAESLNGVGWTERTKNTCTFLKHILFNQQSEIPASILLCLTGGVNDAGSKTFVGAQLIVGFDVVDAAVVAGKTGDISAVLATARAARSDAADVVTLHARQSVAAGGLVFGDCGKVEAEKKSSKTTGEESTALY